MWNKAVELFNEQRHTDMAKGAMYLKKYHYTIIQGRTSIINIILSM
jgi:hypothetical protein